MGFDDRPYVRSGGGGFRGSYGPGPGLGPMMGLPTMTPMVKKLIIINCVVFFLQNFMQGHVLSYFVASGYDKIMLLQIWRLVTFQFLHASLGHLLGNMIGLYFFGILLERAWGSRVFLQFYLICGAVGGLVFELASSAGAFGVSRLIGASGGVLGIITACAILYPHIKVLLFFILPIPIRVLGIGIFILYVMNVMNSGENAGGDLCHLGGMVTGAIWVLGKPMFQRRSATDFRQASGARSSRDDQKLQYQVDEILAKVHREGIGSLSAREKDILRKATERHQSEKH